MCGGRQAQAKGRLVSRVTKTATKTITNKQTAYELESLDGTNVVTDTRYKHTYTHTYIYTESHKKRERAKNDDSFVDECARRCFPKSGTT